MRLIIITGISGAGKSQAIKVFEDNDFFCVDNLPPGLIPKFAEFCFQSGSKMENIALVIDIRGKELFSDLEPALESLENFGQTYDILFLEASDKVLIKRFKETRRMHPLSHEGRLIKGILEERKVLQKIKKKSNYIIDTSNLNPRQLRQEIENVYFKGNSFEGMIINLVSFGFKYGIPIDCDLVFDVRFITNPYYIDSLKKQTGKDKAVFDFVLNHSETLTFLTKTLDLLEFLIPYYIKEGKTQLVIGIGCTGGRHRSVAIGNSIYSSLIEKHHRAIVDHRDIEKDYRGIDK